jgi:hypothetical protein
MVAEAGRADDSVALAEALSLAHHCVLGPEHGALRLKLARELIGEAAGDADAVGWYGAQPGTIRWYQGRIAELMPTLSGLVAHRRSARWTTPTSPGGGRGHDGGPASGGRHARPAARPGPGRPAAFEQLADVDVRRGGGGPSARHAETAAQAYALLSPFARLPMIANLGVTCFGSVHHGLGVASLTTGDMARAVEHRTRRSGETRRWATGRPSPSPAHASARSAYWRSAASTATSRLPDWSAWPARRTWSSLRPGRMARAP